MQKRRRCSPAGAACFSRNVSTLRSLPKTPGGTGFESSNAKNDFPVCHRGRRSASLSQKRRFYAELWTGSFGGKTNGMGGGSFHWLDSCTTFSHPRYPLGADSNLTIDSRFLERVRTPSIAPGVYGSSNKSPPRPQPKLCLSVRQRPLPNSSHVHASDYIAYHT